MAAILIAQQVQSQSFVLLPQDDTNIGLSGSFSLNLDDDGGVLDLGVFGPIAQRSNGWLLFDLGVSAVAIDSYDSVTGSVHAGLVRRFQMSENTILGVNGYLEYGSFQGENYGLASLGGEFEKRNPDSNSFFQLGANYYIPFEDYSDLTLSSALPREGLDAYVAVGRDFDGFGLRGTVSGYNYFETAGLAGLSGYRADGEVEYWKGLPAGMRAFAGLGIRSDDAGDDELDYVANIGFSWEFGAARDRSPRQRGCAIVGNGSPRPDVACGGGKPIFGKGGKVIGEEPPVIAPASAIRRGSRVNAPRRHLGFGTFMTPSTSPTSVASSGAEVPDAVVTSLQIINIATGPSLNTPTSVTHTSSNPAFDGAYNLPFNGGLITSTGPVVEISPGTVTLTSVTAGAVLYDSISCTGHESLTTVLTTFDTTDFTIEVAEGNAAVCTILSVELFASDARLKLNIEPLSEIVNGHQLYAFDYLPSVGISGRYVGVMAQDLVETDPSALVVGADGFYRVKYGELGLKMVTLDEWLEAGPSAVMQ